MKLMIVLAAYNGARFIGAQIKSIQAQTVKEWSLLVRDDGSTDNTVAVVNALIAADPRIEWMQDNHGNMGVTQNFGVLMQAAFDAGADYVALSDQDDIWEPQKLELLLAQMHHTENIKEKPLPVLIHSDVQVASESMEVLHPSFMQLRQISPLSPSLESVLCQNIVTGCTCLMNRALLGLALPMPVGAMLHDWWLAILALTCGKLVYTDQKLVRYRQHGGNVIGVKSRMARLILFLRYGQQGESLQHIADTILQAKLLQQRMEERGIKPPQAIARYSSLLHLKPFKRLGILSSFIIVKRSLFADWWFKLNLLRIPVEGTQ